MIDSDKIIFCNKFTKRATNCKHPIIKKRIAYLSKIDYNVKAHKITTYEPHKPIFTIILTVHDANLEYIKDSLKSVFGQTYHNTEVVLINNGAPNEGAACNLIETYFANNSNAKLITVAKNMYNPELGELLDPLPNLWNAGLFCSTGDYVYFLSYDDKLNLDYVKQMIRLFEDNPKCTSAAPLVVSINAKNDINKKITKMLKLKNNRKRYTKGVNLAKSYMRGENLICFPGGLLAQKSEIVLKYGGFDSVNDYSQIFKFAIHGDSGFDLKATLYWRHHEKQTNKKQKSLGLVYYKLFSNFSSLYNIYQMHLNVAGKDFADEFATYINQLAANQAITSFRDSYIHCGIQSTFSALRNIVTECPMAIIVRIPYYLIRDFPQKVVYILYKNYLPHSLKNFVRKIRGMDDIL